MPHDIQPIGAGRLFGPDMIADPYPVYSRMRESDPVHWDDALGGWFLMRYDDVAQGFRSPLLSAARTGAMYQMAGRKELEPFFTFLSKRMLYNDPPRHTKLRSLVSKAFTPHAIEARGVHIQEVVDRLLDRIIGQGSLDLVHDFAFPLPAIVITEMLGVPSEDRDQLKNWSDAFVVFFTKPLTNVTAQEYGVALEAVKDMSVYFGRFVAERRVRPQDDLLSALVHAQEAGEQLTDEEIFANANLLLVAGHETTTGLICNGILALLRHPEQMQRLQQDPSLIPQAVEEFLRFDGPVHFTHRLATADHTIGGKTIQKGQWVHLVMASANRDAAQFTDPDVLNIARNPNHHVEFGAGYHFCLGAPLARLEARIAFATLLRRLPRMKLAEPVIDYRASFNARCPKTLRLTF